MNHALFRPPAEAYSLILRIADEHGYRPNVIAQSLQSGKSFEIGLIVHDLNNRFFSLKQFWARLPGTSMQHGVLETADPSIIFLVDPQGARVDQC